MSLANREELYTPDAVELDDNYNVLKVSEIHAFEELNNRQRYLEEVASQLNDYIEFYDVDETWILGDTGDFNDAYKILNNIEDTEVKMVAGDEDKDDKKVSGRQLKGWFRPINSAQPFDVDVEYEIFDEGFETEINALTVQAAHHPNDVKREESLNWPDQREGFLENLFSVKRHTNENTLKHEYPPSMEDTDIAIYDHVHMPYERMTGPKAIIGLGGRRSNYQRKDQTDLPLQSLHLSSFDDQTLHQLHFDAKWDEIFEHNVFDFDELEMYFVDVPETEHNAMQGYLPIQSRFKNSQYNTRADEKDHQQPFQWPQSV